MDTATTKNVEVIDINTSSDEEEEVAATEEENNENSKQSGFIIQQTEEKKPEVALTILKIPGPAQILEARRKKIDELLEYYGDTHNRLLSLLPFMNPEQKTQWHKLLNLKLKQVLPEIPFEEPPARQQERPSNSVSSMFNFEDRTLAAAPARRPYPVRRYKVKRKKKPRKRSSPKKSTYSARRTTATKSSSSTYTPKVRVKSEHKPSRSSGFGVTVKKER